METNEKGYTQTILKVTHADKDVACFGANADGAKADAEANRREVIARENFMVFFQNKNFQNCISSVTKSRS